MSRPRKNNENRQLPPLRRKNITLAWLKHGVVEDAATGCWTWVSPPNARAGRVVGYLEWVGWRWWVVEVLWVNTRGRIPDGGSLRPRCKHEDCVNPAHYELFADAAWRTEEARRRGYLGQGTPADPLRGWSRHLCPMGHARQYQPPATNPKTGAPMCYACREVIHGRIGMRVRKQGTGRSQ